MTFREALEREIASQGLSVIEIAEKSNLSKGAIYNIINGKTEEDRIRPATRRAIARGCNRDLEVLEDGGVRFVEGNTGERVLAQASDVAFRLVPARPFLSNAFFRAPFDWLYELESNERFAELQAVDRVFQRREDFLSLVVENRGLEPASGIRFELTVTFEQTEHKKRFPLILHTTVQAGAQVEQSLFLAVGPAYVLEILVPEYLDEEDERKPVGGQHKYVHKGQ